MRQFFVAKHDQQDARFEQPIRPNLLGLSGLPAIVIVRAVGQGMVRC